MNKKKLIEVIKDETNTFKNQIRFLEEEMKQNQEGITVLQEGIAKNNRLLKKVEGTL